MTRLALTLDPVLLARLAREARLTSRTREDVARDAIVAFVESREKERFLSAIALAASLREGENPVVLSEEALLTDNESLAIVERSRPRLRR